MIYVSIEPVELLRQAAEEEVELWPEPARAKLLEAIQEVREKLADTGEDID